MTEWVLFGAFAVALAVAVVAMTRRSARLLNRIDIPPVALLANTAGTQVVLGVVLAGAAWLASVPLSAVRPGFSVEAAAIGTGAGLTISLANAGLVRAFDAAGVGYDESLRDALTPASARGWAFLLFVALPVVAGFEEFLFRGVLVGSLAAGFGVPAWLLAVGASVLFGSSHTAQGPVGVAVTALLGLALSAVFLATDSLLAAAVAHYVVNAVEFGVHAR